MITNTDMLYTRMKQFQDKRKAVMDEYEKRLEWLEDKKGSPFYEKETQQAKNKRDEALQELQGEYRGYLNIAMEAMTKASGRRTIEPPTEEDLRIIQALKMRDTIGEAELTMIANSVKGSLLCLDIVQEVARKNGILKSYSGLYEGKKLSPEFLKEKLDFLGDSLNDFILYDTSRAARIGAEFVERHHGYTKDERELAKRPLFENKEDFFKQFAWISGDTLEGFLDAVDTQ